MFIIKCFTPTEIVICFFLIFQKKWLKFNNNTKSSTKTSSFLIYYLKQKNLLIHQNISGMQYAKYSLLALLLLKFLCLQAQEKSSSPYFFIEGGQEKVEHFPLLSTNAEVNISGVIAEVEVTQFYHNSGSTPIEATYLFPASTTAAVHGMMMTIGERKIKAEIQEKKAAQKAYQQAKQDGKNAALLEQHRPNVFQMKVANIMPNDTIKVVLNYTELLVPEAGIYEFVYPTVVGPRYTLENTENLTASNQNWAANPYLKKGKSTPYDFNIDVCVNAGLPLQKLQSISHQVNIDFTSKNKAEIHLKSSEITGGNKDFILQYQLKGKAIESGILLHENGDENYFLIMMQPPKRIVPKELPKREYIFLIDVSGSMRGFPLDVSKKLLTDLIGNLQPTDKFNLMFFAGSNYLLSPKSLDATPSNLKMALQAIDNQRGGGGTNMLAAIKNTMNQPSENGFSRNFLIITDGYVSVEPQAFDYIENHLGDANFFAFGIGSSVNRHLIEGVAHTGMGEAFVVTKRSEAAAMATRFREYVQSPILTDIEVKFDGLDVYDLNTKNIPDLLGERPLLVYGKYKGKPAGQIEITGQTGKGKYKTTMVINQEMSRKNTALRYLWARKKIEQLSDFADLRYRKNGDAVKAQVTDLGLKYNLLTKYTSFIAIDEKVVNQNGQQKAIKQPLPLPDGVPNSAIGNTDEPIEFINQSVEEETSIMDVEIPRAAIPLPPPPPPAPVLVEVAEIFKTAEEMPRYYCKDCEQLADKLERKKCAEEAMLKEIYSNFKYPPIHQHSTIEGMIILRFVIKKNGTIDDIEVVKGLQEDFNQEAIRVIKLLKKWIPGKQRGRPVDVQYNFPIRIRLD